LLAKVLSSAVIGVDAFLVEVEVDIIPGLPNFTTVGLPEAAVKESKERVKSAVKNSGYTFPDDRITVNLAPAHIKKEGTGFDLPIALGILCATGIIAPRALTDFLFLGELSLDGRIKPVFGSLPMALAAKKAGYSGILVPYRNRKEASVVRGIHAYAARSLAQVVEFLRGAQAIPAQRPAADDMLQSVSDAMDDFAEVKGQEHVKRAMEIAAAGAHNLLMVGPPGAGKTMLARRLTSILPPLTFEEAIETTKIYSVVGMLGKDQSLITQRQFRAPHHTISDAGLIGGGALPRPGEVSLAHNGVLFLDELPEYKKHVIEVLRQPLEDRCVTISRAATSITFPASFMLVAAMNPCPCGYATDAGKRCRCTSSQIQRYRSRISGPLMDRIDMHVDVPAVSYPELATLPATGESSAIRQRVAHARQLQSERFQRSGIYCNAQMGNRHIRGHCHLTAESNAMLQAAAEKFGLSVRAIFRILKMARTIADLDEEQDIGPPHLAEAIQYRIPSDPDVA
jgi:magnesium chelatase family protein